ncbi:MAG: hypothetical protein EBZ07_06865 [Verrucomicrobia bacterium]|nr:hypothetical protein [Verrucomicrobiota bacterium]
MNTTYHTLETEEIHSLQPGVLVELDGEIGMFLKKYSDPNSRIASYSFVMNGGKVRNFKGTNVLMHKNLRMIG